MTKNKAYRYRIYPNTEQKILFAKTFGCTRFIYNKMLADKKAAYEKDGTKLNCYPSQYKEDFPFLKEVDSLALCNSQLNLQSAYKNFFRDKRIGFPKFKSKKVIKDQAYTTNNLSGNVAVVSKVIKLPKVGFVKAKIHRTAPTDWRLKSATITKQRDNKYYISVLYEYEDTTVPVEVKTHIGLDYKSDGLFVASDGTFADMPHFYRENQQKLAKLERKLSKRKLGSKNREKQRLKIAKFSRHIANERLDYLHKLSNEITNCYDLVSVESLNMKAMAKTKSVCKHIRMGKATTDNGYGIFLNMLEYKQADKGHQFVKVSKVYPSSQLCNNCGYKNPITKDLNIRTITCPVCGITYDRDANASKNIDAEGLRLYKESIS